MNTNYWGSINFTDLLAAFGENHSAFYKDANGRVWCNISVWVNESEDKYGNSLSIQLNPKDIAANQKKIYIANLKKNKPKEIPITKDDIKDIQSKISQDLSDLPF